MTAPPRLPLRTRAAIFLRLFAVQGAWNYETMAGNGIAFAVEPALRLLPGGTRGEAYRSAMARQGGYFNSHPYLAGVAVGAIARAELSFEDPERIEKFRAACCGPLGSVGDRLVWAGWLPACSLLALASFGLGASPAGVALLFLGSYNAGHVALRVWGLRVGYRDGLRVAPALGAPLFRQGPAYVGKAAAVIGGIAIPLAIRGVIEPEQLVTSPGQHTSFGLLPWLPIVLACAALGAAALTRLHGRAEGWRLAVVALAVFILFSVAH
ncbi:MAG TPA: PTS system mannose/fructose/sorbose family transporter subunit IID [Gemmatimonadaceae bacterium]|nr:PTS system mannose/fructose/sorbose family transporter subunit IID [Gemmatimonadaceae bacterium]